LKGIVAKARLLRSQVTYDNAINDPRTKAIGHDFGARAVYAAASLDPTRVRKLVGLAVPHGPQLGRAFEEVAKRIIEFLKS